MQHTDGLDADHLNIGARSVSHLLSHSVELEVHLVAIFLQSKLKTSFLALFNQFFIVITVHIIMNKIIAIVIMIMEVHQNIFLYFQTISPITTAFGINSH